MRFYRQSPKLPTLFISKIVELEKKYASPNARQKVKKGLPNEQEFQEIQRKFKKKALKGEVMKKLKRM